MMFNNIMFWCNICRMEKTIYMQWIKCGLGKKWSKPQLSCLTLYINSKLLWSFSHLVFLSKVSTKLKHIILKYVYIHNCLLGAGNLVCVPLSCKHVEWISRFQILFYLLGEQIKDIYKGLPLMSLHCFNPRTLAFTTSMKATCLPSINEVFQLYLL